MGHIPYRPFGKVGYGIWPESNMLEAVPFGTTFKSIISIIELSISESSRFLEMRIYIDFRCFRIFIFKTFLFF